MNRMGQITKIEGDIAIVSFKKHASCGDCGGCHHGEDDVESTAEVLNKINAPLGSFVEIELPDRDVLKAAFYVYLLPLIVMLVAMGATFLAITVFLPRLNPELISAGVGIGAMFLTYVGMRYWETKSSDTEHYMPHVVKIVSNLNEQPNQSDSPIKGESKEL